MEWYGERDLNFIPFACLSSIASKISESLKFKTPAMSPVSLLSTLENEQCNGLERETKLHLYLSVPSSDMLRPLKHL